MLLDSAVYSSCFIFCLSFFLYNFFFFFFLCAGYIRELAVPHHGLPLRVRPLQRVPRPRGEAARPPPGPKAAADQPAATGQPGRQQAGPGPATTVVRRQRPTG